LICVGGGNYTIVAEKWLNSTLITNKTSLIILENENSDYELILKKDWFYWATTVKYPVLRIINIIIALVYSLLLWYVIAMYIEIKNLEQKN
jgi:hypothetical protein